MLPHSMPLPMVFCHLRMRTPISFPVPFGFYAIYRGKNRLRHFRAFQFIAIRNTLVSHMKEQRARARPRGPNATT